jgi:hypothetical protein
VIRKPIITIEPSVRYSFNPVRNVSSVAGSPITLGASGVEVPFSGSVVTRDGVDLSIVRRLMKKGLRREEMKTENEFSRTFIGCWRCKMFHGGP